MALFNRDGYVLNFNDSTFNAFTASSIGEALKQKYGMSKGKSLAAYLNDATDANRTKILVDLFHHYEDEMEHEFNKDYEDVTWWGNSSRYDEKYAKLYQKCKEVVDRLEGSTVVITQTAEELKMKFSSEYLSRHVETVVLLSHKKPDSTISVKVEFGEGEGKVPLDNIAKRAEAYKPKERVTYKMIKEYIEAKYGFKVHTAYIAEVKRSLGLPMYDAPNAVEELKQPRKHPTAEKVEAIKGALRYFGVI